MTESVSIYDPGGWSDSFCQLMAKVTREKILLTDAIFWNKEKFPKLTTRQIKDDIKTLNDHFHFDHHLCETNNQGHMIISDLRAEKKIPVIGITTSGELKRRDTIRKGTSLDKDKTVPWLQKFIEDGIIEFPKTMTPGLKEGMEQIKNYGVSKSGKYQALSGHDDFISCLVILVHWAKRKMLKGIVSNLFGVGGGEPGVDAMKTDYDVALEKVRGRLVGMGGTPDSLEIEFPD